MPERRQYRKRQTSTVIAVKLDLETAGFTYEKWGDTQRCKPGDWVLDNDGDVYTVDRETFERTYRRVGPGVYAKHAPVWAERAEAAGSVETKEGVTHYAAGDYLVFNERDGGDAYAVIPEMFDEMYELDRT